MWWWVTDALCRRLQQQSPTCGSAHDGGAESVGPAGQWTVERIVRSPRLWRPYAAHPPGSPRPVPLSAVQGRDVGQRASHSVTVPPGGSVTQRDTDMETPVMADGVSRCGYPESHDTPPGCVTLLQLRGLMINGEWMRSESRLARVGVTDNDALWGWVLLVTCGLGLMLTLYAVVIGPVLAYTPLAALRPLLDEQSPARAPSAQQSVGKGGSRC